MARVRKTVVTPGTHFSPDGRVEVTPERVRHWVDTFRSLKGEGVKFPLPWGHALAARPGGDDTAFLRSRYNAGYIEDLEQSADGALVAVLDAPALKADGLGNLIDPLNGTAIAEVSAGIGDWTDGKGRTHKDIINHVALTPLPVWAGQDGFTPLSTGQAAPMTCLSTRTAEPSKLARLAAVTDKDFDGVADTLTDPAAPAPDAAAPAEPEVNPATDAIAKCKAAMSQAGLTVADVGDNGDDPIEFIKHVTVALAALNSQPPAPEAKAVADPAKTTVVEQTPPAMMATGQPTPREQALTEQVEATQRAERAKRIDALAARGLPPAEAKALREQSTQTRLSLTADFKPAPAAVDEKLDLLERVLPAAAPHLQRLGDTAVEHTNPAAKDDTTAEVHGVPLTADAKAEVERMKQMTVGTGRPKHAAAK